MKGDTRTKAQKQRALYQEREREHLRNMGLIQYALECVDKMKVAEDSFELSKWDKVADKYITLSKRYLPELKAIEINGALDGVENASDISDAILQRIAAGGSAGTAQETGSEGESTSLH